MKNLILPFLRFHKDRSIPGIEPTPVEYRPYTLPLCYGHLKSIQFNSLINCIMEKFFLYHENVLHGFYAYMLRNKQGYTWLILLLRIILFHDIGVKYTIKQLKRFGFGKGKDWGQLHDGANKTSGVGLQFGRTCNGIVAEVQLCHAS